MIELFQIAIAHKNLDAGNILFYCNLLSGCHDDALKKKRNAERSLLPLPGDCQSLQQLLPALYEIPQLGISVGWDGHCNNQSLTSS